MENHEQPTNPFPGLRPFEYNESYVFFGRDGQTGELLTKLHQNRFVTIVGSSSSGKSSLVRASLLPALHGGMMAGSWRVTLTHPGSDPLNNLAVALVESFRSTADSEVEIQLALARASLMRSSLGLVEFVRQATRYSHENLLLVVDQFEELFRYSSLRGDGEDGVDAFVQLLLTAINQRELPIYVVLLLRSDYLGDCARFWGLPEALNTSLYIVPRMTRDQCREAITGPVAVFQARIEPQLVNRLLNDIFNGPDHLPLLQHALQRTWNYWRTYSSPDEPVCLVHYEAVGALSESLERHAEEIFAELDIVKGRLAELVFKQLVELTDSLEYRRPTLLRDICAVAEATPEQIIPVIDVFRREGSGLLMPPAGSELTLDTVIDISHESLIRNWRRLRGWVREETESAKIYIRLAQSAMLYGEGKAGLLRNPDLQFALDWRERQRPNSAWACRYHPEYDQTINFLESSKQSYTRSRRRFRLLVYVFATTLVALAAISLWLAVRFL